MKKLEQFDKRVILFLREHHAVISRIALFIIFFWFGILKIPNISPAGPLVTDLLEVTFLGWVDPIFFVQIFGVFEVVLAFLILIPKLERITFALLAFHLFTTVMPLFLIPHVVWDGFLLPNITGQYIIKNVALLSLGLVLFTRLRPMSETHKILAEEERVLFKK
jgi:uncharacterized membrane protein YkgB